MSQMPEAPRIWLSSFLPTAKQAVFGLIAIVVTAIVTAAITSYYTRTDNFELAKKQQQMSEILKVRSSGTSLDTSFRSFNDALVDEINVQTARETMRAAIAQHSSEVFSLESILGREPVEAYIKRLADLRAEVDEATNPVSAIPMAQKTLDIIAERQRLLSAAEAKIGYNPTKDASH